MHSRRRRSVEGDRGGGRTRGLRSDRDVHARTPIHQGRDLRQCGERSAPPVENSRVAGAGRSRTAKADQRGEAGMTPMRAVRELTAPVEDYLKAIYELEAADG